VCGLDAIVTTYHDQGQIAMKLMGFWRGITVAAGPHIRRKFWQTFTVVGGKVDEHSVSIAWKISKGTFRAVIDSALGLEPQDMGEAAKAKRVLRGLSDLSGITFAAKIRVEPANDPRYSDSNRLDRVVLPGEPE
jgi:hypothetical protein